LTETSRLFLAVPAFILVVVCTKLVTVFKGCTTIKKELSWQVTTKLH